MGEGVVVVAGLPGSGKTTCLCQMCRDGWIVFDDFKANAYENSSAFRDSRKLRAVLTALRDDLKCVIADIDFCKTDSRSEAECVLLSEVPGVKLAWRFFANNYHACETNIKRRNRPSLQADLDKLREYSTQYQIPVGAETLPVGAKSTT
jgi:hypothetical protein